MRIAVLNIQVPFIKGGAEVLAEDLIRELNKRGHDTELITIPFVASPIINRLKNIEFWKELDLKTSFNGKIDKVIALKWPTYAAQHDNMTLWLLHQHRVVYDLWDNQAVNSLSSQKDGLKLKEEITSFDTKYIGSLKNRFTISRNVSNRLKKFNGIDSEVLYPPPQNRKALDALNMVISFSFRVEYYH